MSKGKKKRTALGNRLRTLRRYNGMTQREVAARLHLERSSYAYYEIGTTEPDLHTLSAVSYTHLQQQFRWDTRRRRMDRRDVDIVQTVGIRCHDLLFLTVIPDVIDGLVLSLIHIFCFYPLW